MTKIVESGYLNFIVSKVLKVSTSYSILSYLPFLRKTYFLLWPGWDVSRGWVGAGERLSAIAGDHPLFVLLFVIAHLKQIYPEFSSTLSWKNKSRSLTQMLLKVQLLQHFQQTEEQHILFSYYVFFDFFFLNLQRRSLYFVSSTDLNHLIVFKHLSAWGFIYQIDLL